ncbi:MAG: DUF2793 domain-containing protein [Alphaproteobacteria bacterium]|nr:DUF2793 domain-containing protein [Alphaproteobacteria bacterium]MBL7097818.1 DUF2793 domain-containing protein [Alphaproteobacteria bacterium]
MTDTTPRSGMPLLAAAQAQKHVTHNEALMQLDALLYARVLDRDLAAPPASPADGDAYLVNAAAAGVWTGQSGKIAAALDGAWRFYPPFTGLSLYVADEQKLIVFDGASWLDYAAILTLQNVPLVGVNTTADATNRLAVKSAAVLFDNAGAGVQARLNKHATADTASLLCQTNYSGRAELGLSGDDNFHLKVSPDGASWVDALVVDKATGYLGLGTAAPDAPLTINMTGASGPTAPAGTAFHTIANSTNGRAWTWDVYASNGSIRMRRTNGSNATPIAVTANDILGAWANYGHDGIGFSGPGDAAISMRAVENFSATAHGTIITLSTTQAGTATQSNALLLWDDKRLQAYGAYVDLSYFYQAPASGFSLTIPDATGLLLLDPATTLATGAITMAPNPRDGQVCRIASSQAITALTLAANTGQTLSAALTTLAAGAFAEYTYRGANSSWYRTG